ncbi:MAG: hypothetical protein L0312_20565, partial [Acidobacteria bacterium]|nr:hypothetical protein [Acidobacteriota bacterium]
MRLKEIIVGSIKRDMSITQEEVERLMNEGFAALENCSVKRAIKIGQRLKKMRHSSAFEILALAHDLDDDPNKAIEVLEEGVCKAPTAWRLWQLLGN